MTRVSLRNDLSHLIPWTTWLALVNKTYTMIPALASELNGLIGADIYRPAISIILPFEPKMSLKSVLNQSLKGAVAQVERELESNYPAEIAELMMDKLAAIISNLNFGTHKKSVAIFVSPVFEKVLYLDIPVKEKVVVSGSFEIRDLVHNKKQLRQYLVLMLSAKQFGMFLGTSNTLKRIISNTPESVYAYINDVPEKVANFTDVSSRKEIVMDKFLLQVDNALDIILGAYRVPLFVLGTEKISGHFKSHTRHAKAVVGFVPGNYEKASTDEIMRVLKPNMEKWDAIIQKDLLNQLEDAADKKKLVFGMRDVWKEATNRQGRLLVVEKDYMRALQRGLHQPAIYMPAKRYNKFSNVKDAVDDIIQAVLESGGDVEFVDNDVLKMYQHIALVKYH